MGSVPHEAAPRLDWSRSQQIRKVQGNVRVGLELEASTARRSSSTQPRLVDGVAGDAAVTLEFLALGRQRVLQSVPDGELMGSEALLSIFPNSFNPILSEDQVRALMIYHEANVAWIHNVVHLPTFRDECDAYFSKGVIPSDFWVALYYAMLSVCLNLAGMPKC